MKKIIQFSLHNKLAIWLMTIIVVVAGLYSGMKMKLETIPDITIPVITVTTIYPGATPDEISEKITDPIEKRVQHLTGVKAVDSTAMSNASSIVLEYNYGVDMDKAVNEINDSIKKVSLPEGAQETSVSKININAFPVYSVSVSDKNKSLEDLTKIAEEKIAPALEGVEGVSSVNVSGQQVQEVNLTYKEDKLKEYGLTKETVEGIIKGSALKLPLGLYPIGEKETSVVVDGNIATMEDLENVHIPGATPVTLKDIATLTLVKKAESISKTNGKEAISIQVVKTTDANTVDVVNGTKDEIKKLKKEYKGLTITSTFDQGKPIEESVHTMLNKAIIGAAFAVVIILLFLRDIRSTIISIISIPLSLLIAVLLLKEMDITLNIMTLGAMTVAIGRVIDDSIVVIENIYRRMSLTNEKLKGKELILSATKEVFVPIMSSTMVTIAVFLPLGLVKGMVGELFLPFALTIVFALLASLLVAITIVPMMAHLLFKKGVKHTKNHEENHGLLEKGYKRVLTWSLKHKITTFLLAIVLLIGSLFLVPKIGFSFMSSEEEKMIIPTYQPGPGQTEKQVQKIAEKTEQYFMDKKDVKLVQYSVGGKNPMDPSATNQAAFYVEYKKNTKDFEKEKEKVAKDLEKLSSKGEWGYQNASSSGTSNSVTLYVYGEDKKEVEPIVQDVVSILKKQYKSFKNIDSSLSDSYDEYRLVANQEKLSSLGLTAAQIGTSMSNTGQAPVLTTVKKDGKEVNVYVQAEKTTYNTIDDITNKTVTSPLSMEVPIKDVVTVEKGTASDTITKRDGKYYAEVSADIKAKNVSKASSDLQKSIDKLTIPSTASVDMGGVTEDMNESFMQLGLAIAAAVAVVYLVLVITFGGGLAPFAILFSLPFTVIGALVGLLIAGETISVSSLIGVLMLIGIVVTNAIVLVDRVIHKENEGLSTRAALLEAATTRLRPILMTALATVGALIPLAIGVEGGGLISKGLGVTVIGGLISSTLLTLVVVPIVYETLMSMKKWIKSKAKKKKD